MTPRERWLGATWPLVRTRLPVAPACVVELGCGPLGGFVPRLRSAGYDAIGVDPQAPEGPQYQQIEFERAELPRHVDAVVASTSLHHVTSPAHVLDRITSTLRPGARLVVVEWAWERFDEPTAGWCFNRLGPDDEPGWLHRRRSEWLASGRDWLSHFREWADGENLHAGATLIRLLDQRFERQLLAYGPYFFADLPGTAVPGEQAAIEAGQIQATRIDWVGVLR